MCVFQRHYFIGISMNQKQRAGRNLVYPVNWRDDFKAPEPFLNRGWEILVSDDSDIAKVLDGGWGCFFAGKRAEVSRAGASY